MITPNWNCSRAVVVGTSTYAGDLPALPAIEANLRQLAECLSDPNVCGMPALNCRLVHNPEAPADLIDAIADSAAAATDTLVVYYAGHGLIDPFDATLHLSVVRTDPRKSYTAAPYEQVRRVLLTSPARRRIVILDCCYSGRALGVMSHEAGAIFEQASADGTFLLASAAENKHALSPEGEPFTAFTGELIYLLRDGVLPGPEFFDLDFIYRHATLALRAKSRPEPQKRDRNTAGDLAIARNVKWASRPVRLGLYNFDRFGSRPRVDLMSRGEARRVKSAYDRLSSLLDEEKYTDAIKRSIAGLLEELELDRSDVAHFLYLRTVAGEPLFRRSRSRGLEILATGRDDWVGYLEWVGEEVHPAAFRNTIRVVRDVGADVLCVVSAASEFPIKRLTDSLLRNKKREVTYPNVLFPGGNDVRGTRVGVMTRHEFPIIAFRSHDTDTDERGVIFTSDCADFRCLVAPGREIVMLVMKFDEGDRRRRYRQARRGSELYTSLRDSGSDLVCVAGSLAGSPVDESLGPLLEGTDLRDISTHPGFVGDGRVGTVGSGSASQKVDYILLSPALFMRTTGGGVVRYGVWSGFDGGTHLHYPEVTGPHMAASDHAALFADVEL